MFMKFWKYLYLFLVQNVLISALVGDASMNGLLFSSLTV